MVKHFTGLAMDTEDTIGHDPKDLPNQVIIRFRLSIAIRTWIVALLLVVGGGGSLSWNDKQCNVNPRNTISSPPYSPTKNLRMI